MGFQEWPFQPSRNGEHEVSRDALWSHIHIGLFQSALCGGALIGAWVFKRVGYIKTVPLAPLLTLVAMTSLNSDFRLLVCRRVAGE